MHRIGLWGAVLATLTQEQASFCIMGLASVHRIGLSSLYVRPLPSPSCSVTDHTVQNSTQSLLVISYICLCELQMYTCVIWQVWLQCHPSMSGNSSLSLPSEGLDFPLPRCESNRMMAIRGACHTGTAPVYTLVCNWTEKQHKRFENKLSTICFLKLAKLKCKKINLPMNKINISVSISVIKAITLENLYCK